MDNSCHGKKLKQDKGDVAFTKYSCVSILNVFFINHKKIHKINFIRYDSSGIFYNDNRTNSSRHSNPKHIWKLGNILAKMYEAVSVETMKDKITP